MSAPSSGRPILVIYNPTAGQWRRRRLKAVLAALRAQGSEIRLHETRHPGDAEAKAREAGAGAYGVVVAAGGDGTINEVANGLMAAKGPVPSLAIIPLGTANVLAQEIGLKGGARAIAAAIAANKSRPIHPGRANGRHFLMMAGVGFDAHVVANVSLALKRRTGKIAYVCETLAQALRYGFPACSVGIDGVTHGAVSVVVCNGRHYGGPFVAAPAADLERPGFEICLLKKGGFRHVLRYGLALMTGRLSHLPDVDITSGTHVTITGAPGLPVQADGDIIAALPVEIAVADTTLDLVMPD